MLTILAAALLVAAAAEPGAEAASVAPIERGSAEAKEPTETAQPVQRQNLARPKKRKGKPAVAGVININRASEAELRLLPGIGRGRASAIVERRQQHPFTSVDELARMKGMRGVVRKLRKQLTVQGDTTVHPAAEAERP